MAELTPEEEEIKLVLELPLEHLTAFRVSFPMVFGSLVVTII